MSIVSFPASFRVMTVDRTDIAATTVALSASDMAATLALLPANGDWTYLVLDNGLTREVLRVSNANGQLAWIRAQDGTVAVTHPRGSCLSADMTGALVKDIVCNYDCCAGDCPCAAVAFAGKAVETAVVGQSWNATVVFSGDLPMALAASGQAPWMTTIVGPNYIQFSGTPTVTGNYAVSVTATNCAGKLATTVLQVTV